MEDKELLDNPPNLLSLKTLQSGKVCELHLLKSET